ncbi:radical SAM protein [Nonlabens dokdonensis]|uniref:Radical SAM protein n=1 Tax=Nonlabens dokdonensis TaxID=328515 RepID=A0A1Z8AX53_9FLAO|nr:B12-binding domain-containing radical SAM protein [Nonlabens dokdonensis]OUS14910.1 radical SAM protein [Nonlabens dokdonensis]
MEQRDLLLITPPFTQLNTPYPATAYIKGFLNTKDVSAFQMDLGIEVILALFSKDGMELMFEKAFDNHSITSQNSQRIYALQDQYLQVLEPVISFLQGKNETLARQICSHNYLPRASRFEQLDDMEWAFGNMGMQDKAKHLATLYLEDLSDFIKECVDENFGFSRYAERLGMSANSFDELYEHLESDLTPIDQITLDILEKRIQEVQPKLVCLSVPFPGNLYSSLRCGQYIKKHYPHIKIAFGGGFANTELRSVTDVRVFEFIDYIALDDGELPLELIVNDVLNCEKQRVFKRTFILENNKVVYKNNCTASDYKQSKVGTPDYSDLLLDEYISVIEIANPMHSLWSDGRWNKLTMAHGCYWGKCTFCDVSLDYIKLYEPVAAEILVDRMEQLIAQTGESGFHFVDEAAPPALMRAVALEILKRKLSVTWWTNIRFEKNFTQDLCHLLKASGCIAVSGGLEVASDRLLKLIDKGVTVAQVAQVTRNLTESGIMVHAYLMYGYPTQTVQETVDSLEMVRQLFELGIIQSGFWHQFALTAHSPVGMNPEEFGITPQLNPISFANNDVQFDDPTGVDHEQFSYGLKKSLFNYMHGIGFELDLQDWFDFKVPQSQIDPHYIEDCLNQDAYRSPKSNHKLVWLGNAPLVAASTIHKKGKEISSLKLQFHQPTDWFEIELEASKADWLMDLLDQSTPTASPVMTYGVMKKSYESRWDQFDTFWFSEPMEELKANGFLVL